MTKKNTIHKLNPQEYLTIPSPNSESLEIHCLEGNASICIKRKPLEPITEKKINYSSQMSLSKNEVLRITNIPPGHFFNIYVLKGKCYIEYNMEENPEAYMSE